MAYPINIATYTATISSGSSLSTAIATGGQVPIGIVMPAGWDTAGLSFAVSADGTNFLPLYDMSAEVTAAGAAGIYVALLPDKFIGVNLLKIRSGTVGSAVNQTADRSLSLVTKVL